VIWLWNKGQGQTILLPRQLQSKNVLLTSTPGWQQRRTVFFAAADGHQQEDVTARRTSGQDDAVPQRVRNEGAGPNVIKLFLAV